MKVTGKANIRNRFDIVCRDTRTGEETKYQAHNIVLDSMWSRLVNFQPFFDYIHFGTGTGTLSPARTSLFNRSGGKAATSVSARRALPTSYRQQQIVLNPEEYVGHELTEVGVAYGSSSSNLVTHAFIEDSEGNPISIVKTDTMVVTIYATIFFELGELTSMYGGQWRWVMPLTRNELVSYLMGATYPTQTFRVTRAFDFAPASHEGVAPTSHGQSSNIFVADWSRDAANKRVTTPVRRLDINTGNGAIRGFGLGSSDFSGTFRGQFPISGVFAGHTIEGEAVGIGDGETTGFDLAWDDPQSLTLKIDGMPVDQGDYDLLPKKKGANLFSLRVPYAVSGELAGLHVLTDNDDSSGVVLPSGTSIAIDTEVASVPVSAFRLFHRSSDIRTVSIQIRGANNPDLSDSVLLSTLTSLGIYEWQQIDFDPAVAYRYWVMVVDNGSPNQIGEIQLLTADHQITFDTPPDVGAVITADYTVPYIPKDKNHVLDLQCSIQWGEG